jgi:hypothetical protein
MSVDKKRVLIGLFGLSRTFKTTSKLLFEKIINPNIDNFDFDIVINTDFESNVLTAYREDNVGSVSKYKYDNVDALRSELTEYYNVQNQLKDIIIYNKETHFIVYPFFVVYKRIQQILKNRFDKNEKYDIYIMLRLDIIIDKVLFLNDVNNEVVLGSANFTREVWLHDRDIVDCFLYGNYLPFMYWIYSTTKYFESLTNRKPESLNFFVNDRFCDDNIIQLYLSNQSHHHKIYENNEIYQILNIVKLNHTDCKIFDYYNFNNAIVPYCPTEYYGVQRDDFVINYLYIMSSILKFSGFHLTENRNNIFIEFVR